MTTEDEIRAELEAAGVSSLFATTITADSIIVLEAPERLTQSAIERLQALLDAVFPHNRRVILDGGLTLKVVHPEPRELVNLPQPGAAGVPGD